MKKLSKEKQKNLVIVAIVTAVVSAGLWQTLIASQRSKIAKLSAKHAEEVEKFDKAKRLLDTRKEIDKRYETLTTRLREIEGEMVSGDMYAWVIQTVKNFRTPYRDRVDIPNFSREVLAEVQMFPKFPYKAAVYNIKGTAYYHDLGRFISDLENRFPFYRVQNLEIEPVGGSSASSAAAAAAAAASTTPGGSTNEELEKERLAFRFEWVALVNPVTN
jgi:Tfp pilus assembly protein PilO